MFENSVKEQYFDKDTVFVDDIFWCSAPYVPATDVVAPTNGLFPGLVSGKYMAEIGSEWMELSADVQIKECRSGSVRRRTLPAGAKIRLLDHGNATAPARVAVILPQTKG
jgi:hypothetical protein